MLEILLPIVVKALYNVTTSSQCSACLASSMLFCQDKLDNETGYCASTYDTKSDGYLCSNELSNPDLNLVLCPFDSSVCGKNELITLSSDGSLTNLQPRYGFQTNSVCMYQILPPSNVINGYMYLQLQALVATKVKIVIAPSLTSSNTITCEVD